MKLQDGMILYHGSYMPVERIDLAKCFVGKDFGKGFYLTSDIQQAKRFIGTSLRKAIDTGKLEGKQTFGYLSFFEFHGNPESLHYFNFQEADEQWLRFVAFNRTVINDNSFLNALPKEICKAEIISGKVANDRTNPVITAYLGGLYGPITEQTAIETAIRLLKTNTLKDQFCFLTQKAVDCLVFKEAIKYE